MSKFALGQVVATPAALELLSAHRLTPWALVRRHADGDWGDIDPEDKQANEDALKDGGRLLSSYRVGCETVWVITEWDRSVTTVLLPDDY